MQDTRDIIDGGEGGDCIILAGSGTTTVSAGSGDDKIVRIPPNATDAEIDKIVAACGGQYASTGAVNDPPKPAWAKDLPPPTKSKSASALHAGAAPFAPAATSQLDVDVLAILCATILGIVILSTRFSRSR